MREIQLKDAKAALSALLDSVKVGAPVVIMPRTQGSGGCFFLGGMAPHSNVQNVARLLTSAQIEADDLPPRDKSPMRDADL